MKLIPFDSDSANDYYHKHYNQIGGGDIRVFKGGRYQKGYGLGSIFGSLIKSALPIVKQGIKAIGKTALSSGLKVASDGLRGRNLKESFQEHVQDAGNELLHKSLGSLRRVSVGNNKKKRNKSRPARRISNLQTKRRKVSSSRSDIFS